MIAARSLVGSRVAPIRCVPRARGFRALVAKSAKSVPPGTPTVTEQEFSSVSDLPRQDPDATVEVQVEYSTLNYKDGLILTGQPGVVREWPLVPGIDYAGRVVRSRSPLWREGDAVMLTGNKAGQFFDGGYAERATCQAEWLVPTPDGLDTFGAMVIGSAGMTAMQCILHLERFGEWQPERCHRSDARAEPEPEPEPKLRLSPNTSLNLIFTPSQASCGLGVALCSSLVRQAASDKWQSLRSRRVGTRSWRRRAAWMRLGVDCVSSAPPT